MTLVAIDGPGGAGKSTVARALARRLGLERLDTGAMYRAVTLVALRGGIDLGDGERLGELARVLDLTAGDEVVIDEEDVTTAIRSREVEAAVSVVAAHKDVRAALVERQRAWIRSHGGGVVEGRDITSVVAPNADVRVYLTADPHARAARRARERAPSAGESAPMTVGAVARDMAERDALDSSREHSPLHLADGVHVLDTTDRSVSEVVEEICAWL